MQKHLVAMVLALSFPSAWSADPAVRDDLLVVYSKPGEFAEVRDSVSDAIKQQGLVINYVAHVGDMLERTGRDLGLDEQLYVHAEVFEFCSAVISREMMAANPMHIGLCPYTIQVFELPESPGTIYIGYRRPPKVADRDSQAALDKVENLLERIVEESLSF